jgi:hypothetical protein
MTGPAVECAELSASCAAAGIEVPGEDLPALAEALANHRAAAEQLRAVDVTGVELSAGFDPRWA